MTSSTLHDRFALPFDLQADLDTVLEELDAAGLGLEAPIQTVLRHDGFRFLGQPDAGHWQDWALSVDGVTLPLRPERDSRGDLKVFGVRYASFAPRSGLHPVLGSQAPLTLTLCHADHGVQYTITLHEWRPDGEAYPGLPADLIEAGERRAARMTVVTRERAARTPRDESGTAEASQAGPGLTAYSLDRRYR